MDLLLPGFPSVSIIGGFLFLALPGLIAGMIAVQRDVPIVPAAILGMLGSWFGVALVAAFYRPPLVTWADPTSGPSADRTEMALRDDEAAVRLRRLQHLRDEGLITENEFEARRNAVLETI